MIPQIGIYSRMGIIGTRYTGSQLQIKTKPADLHISAPAARLSITYEPGQLTIDQTQAFADEGLRKPLAFLQYEAAKARQAVSDRTASTAQWSEQLLHTHGNSALKQYAGRNDPKRVQLVPTLVPSPFSVKIHYQPGGVRISTEMQPVQVDTTSEG